MTGELLFRLFGLVIFGLIGWQVGLSFLTEQSPLGGMLSTLLAALLGFAISPYLTTRPFGWLKGVIGQVPAADLLASIVGVLLGLIVAAPLALPMSLLPDVWGEVLPLAVSVVLACFGVTLMLQRGRDLWQVVAPFRLGLGIGTPPAAPMSNQVLVDTSAIIDGRIADISQTGFVNGALVIPRFILDELRHIADSPDALRRNRGRRGLDMLKKLQKESDVPIQITEADAEDIQEVDGKLIKLAKTLRCPIVTTDFNLNRVAELQGVRVLNINELANAVKTVVLPGEEMAIKIIQEGKEVGQGVGFLDDGTMVVVEGGRRYINNHLDIIVTRVLQTVAGRMIFAHPKLD